MTDGEPQIVTLPERPYVAIPAVASVETLGSALPPLIGEVFGWLGRRGAAPAGAPFWKYNVVDMPGRIDVEVGVPVAAPQAGDSRVVAGALPGGRYVTVRHVGPPGTLAAATAELLDWAAARDLKWDITGERWCCRLENYLTDPVAEPDMNNWVTEISIRLAD